MSYYFGDGRVGKNDLSFDGRSWEYRDPSRDSGASDPRGRGIDTREYAASNFQGKKLPQDLKYNENSLDYLDPLYDYSKGQVADAAKKLGIGNIDEKAEVKAILEEIRKPKSEPERIITKYITDNSEKTNEVEDSIPVVNPHDPIPAVSSEEIDNIYRDSAESVADNTINDNPYRYSTSVPNAYESSEVTEANPFSRDVTTFMSNSKDAQDLLASKMGELMFGKKEFK